MIVQAREEQKRCRCRQRILHQGKEAEGLCAHWLSTARYGL